MIVIVITVITRQTRLHEETNNVRPTTADVADNEPVQTLLSESLCD
jgi:hypothetical protein